MTVQPLTPERWRDLDALFGENGACAGCWCMFWRLPRPAFLKGAGQPNKRAFRKLVESGDVPGLLGYEDGKPIAWVAVGPRERYVRLAASKVLAPVDQRPVWSIVCLFVARPYRRKGITAPLLAAAAEYARSQRATLVEGYPTEPDKRMGDAFLYTGIASAFRRAGFTEAARRSAKRPIMRKMLV